MTHNHSVEKSFSWVNDRQIEFWHVVPEGTEKFELPTIVFIHGWGLSPQSYLELLKKISNSSFHVVAPSLPGFGKSDPLNFSLANAYSETVDHLYEGLVQEGIANNSVFFTGHSFGAGLTVGLVEKNPSLTHGMVLLCPIGGSPGNPVSWMKLVAGLRHEWGNSSVERAKDALPSFFKNPLYLASSGIAAKNTDLLDSLQSVSGSHGIPVTVIAAENDGVVPIGKLRTIEQIKLNMVQGNHGWPLTNAEECSSLVLESVSQYSTVES